MVQTANRWDGDDFAALGRFEVTRGRRVAVERLVTPRSVVIAQEGTNQLPQMARVRDDYVIEQLTAQSADKPFDERTLPRRARRDDDFLAAQVLHRPAKLVAIDVPRAFYVAAAPLLRALGNKSTAPLYHIRQNGNWLRGITTTPPRHVELERGIY